MVKKTNINKFKTRFIAATLTATIFSAGAMTYTTTFAAENSESIISSITSTTTNFFKESSLGFVKNAAWKIVGPELTKVGLTPILNMYLGIEEEGPSNQDVMDKIDKSTAEIKAEIAKVLDAAMEGL